MEMGTKALRVAALKGAVIRAANTRVLTPDPCLCCNNLICISDATVGQDFDVVIGEPDASEEWYTKMRDDLYALKT